MIVCFYHTGDGMLDGFLLNKCTPELQHYIGLEPHEPSFDELRKTMMNFTDIKVIIVKMLLMLLDLLLDLCINSFLRILCLH